MYNKVLVPVVWAGSVCTPRNVPCGVFRNRDVQPNRRNLAYLFPWRKVDGREMSRARPESKRRVLRVFGSSVRPFELQDSDDLRMEVLGRQDAHAGRQSLVDCEAFRQFFLHLLSKAVSAGRAEAPHIDISCACLVHDRWALAPARGGV